MRDCRFLHHIVRWCTNFQRKKKNETRCIKFSLLNIGMCTVHRVHFLCKLFGQKMPTALEESVGNEKIKFFNKNIY